ncbi:MAG: bifunctional hydroxymethylpyrimidine kinase/phosphomethylpyrimidine kinase, partial [Clostridia bacterium]|nr:bifunctional hydroxymethylpyrimidine kinase/phosphomethylpyrimidine kinase [Clostridia bacterium]
RRVRELSKQSAVTIISGGIPKGVKSSYYGELFQAADPSSLRVADATGGKLLSAVAAGVDLVKPNLAELQDCFGRELKTRQEILEGCGELIRLGAKIVLLSLGRQGAIITDGTKHFYCRSNSVAVNSTVGAGDAMVAAAAIKLKDGAPMPEILRAGVAAGTAAITTFDEQTFSMEKYVEIHRGLRVEQY